MRLSVALSALLLVLVEENIAGFSVQQQQQQHQQKWQPRSSSSSSLCMALDDAMHSRLDGIRRSYQALTERLGDPDVLGDSKLLQKVMSDRAQSEEVVQVYDEHCQLSEELEGAKELFQEAGDDPDMKEMAREEMKQIEPQLEELEEKIKILMLPKDPNDGRNVMLEIRAGTGGSEASIFAGEKGVICLSFFKTKYYIRSILFDILTIVSYLFTTNILCILACVFLLRGVDWNR